jgi:DNA-binding CsgD family transcriptional regulator
VTIEELLPSLAPPGHRSEEAADRFANSAREMMGLLRDLVHCQAFLLSSWDPLSNSHRHQTVVSDGYTDDTISHVNDEYVGVNPAFKVSHTQSSRSLRWRDYERDWQVYFQDTRTAQEFLIPAGFHEGTTVCLRLPNGRYTGAMHMSWASPAAATDERREIIERFRSVLAMACDLLRAPQLLASALNPGACALIVSPSGVACELPGRPAGQYLGEGGALRQLLLERLQCWRSPRFLWPDEFGCCHRVTLTACPGGSTLVTEERVPWPFGLSLREIQVLNLIVDGASNPEIAEQLFISTRTASTHVEHILTKMGCSSRTRLAAITVTEGLLLPDGINGRKPRAALNTTPKPLRKRTLL